MMILKSIIKYYGLGILILCIGIVILFQSHQSEAGIPLKNPKISKQEATRMYEEMKRQKEEIIRREREEKEKKKAEAEKKEQLMKAMEAPTLTEESKEPSKKEGMKEEKEEEEIGEKPIPAPSGREGEGIVPGVMTEEEKIEEAKKIEKREEAAKEVKTKRDFSFILVIIVMLATIMFLVRSMKQGKRQKTEDRGQKSGDRK